MSDFNNLPVVDINEAKHIIASRMKARMDGHKSVRQVLLFGHRGNAKSELIKQVADELNIGFKSTNLAALEAPDFQGLPYIINDKTHYAKPTVFPEFEAGIWLLDEINRNSLDIRQALLQLLTERQVNGHRIPDKIMIVAAGNLSDDMTQYSVDELDPALADRFATYRLNPKMETIIGYLQSVHGINHPGIRWLKFDNNVISTNGKGPSPRSFDAMCHALTACTDVDPFMVVNGELGRLAAESFRAWYASPESVSFVDVWNCTSRAEHILNELQTKQGGRIELLRAIIDGFAEKLAPMINGQEQYRVFSNDEAKRVAWLMERLTAPEWQTSFIAECYRFMGIDFEAHLIKNRDKIKEFSPKSIEWANAVHKQIIRHQEKTDEEDVKDTKKKKK